MPSLIHRLCVVALLMSTALSARAVDTLFVREEFGVSYALGNATFLLPLDGPAQIYDEGEGGDRFSLAYRGGFLVMTALVDNHIADDCCAAFLLNIYRAGGPYIPGARDEPTTSIGGVIWWDFPTKAGQSFRQEVPAAAVPEPSVLAMLPAGVALLWAAAMVRRRTGRHAGA
jgi:hypothetical protein